MKEQELQVFFFFVFGQSVVVAVLGCSWLLWGVVVVVGFFAHSCLCSFVEKHKKLTYEF